MQQDPTESLVARFVYKSDRVDRWTLLDSPSGTLYGDCEDFAMTALWLICEKSWMHFWWKIVTFQAMIWYGKVGNEGHAMLWVRGWGWIDNTHPVWSKRPPHRIIYPYIAPSLLLAMLLKRG